RREGRRGGWRRRRRRAHGGRGCSRRGRRRARRRGRGGPCRRRRRGGGRRGGGGGGRGGRVGGGRGGVCGRGGRGGGRGGGVGGGVGVVELGQMKIWPSIASSWVRSWSRRAICAAESRHGGQSPVRSLAAAWSYFPVAVLRQVVSSKTFPLKAASAALLLHFA